MKNIAVFFGGCSVEHDISIITGVMTANSLDKEKYNAIPIYVDKSGAFFTGKILFDLDEFKEMNLKKLTRVTFVSGENALYAIKGRKIKPLAPIKACINCLHGEHGEDGTIAGLLKTCNIPLASPDIMSSAVCMDKEFTKIALKGMGIKTVKGVLVNNLSQVNKVIKKFKFPLIVKPVTLGSSIGIGVAHDEKELSACISRALRYSEDALIEPFLSSITEVNCAGYMDSDGTVIISECEIPISRGGMLSFKDKYVGGKRIFPANIDKKLSEKIKALTEKIYKTFKFSGVIRIDYFLLGEEVLVNEINAVPGSLAYYLFGDTLKSFSVMIDKIIDEAICRHARKSTIETEYKSGILKMAGSKGAKKG